MRLSAHNALRSALAASLIAHAALGWCFGQIRLNTQPSREPEPPVLVEFDVDDAPRPDPQLALGIDESNARDAQWLGVAEVDEAQQARQAELEQAALALRSSTHAPTVSDQVDRPRVPSLPPARPAPPPIQSTIAHAPDTPLLPLDASTLQLAAIEPALQAAEPPIPSLAPSRPLALSPSQAMPPRPAQPESPGPSSSASGAPGNSDQGRVSDKEAPGSSTQEPIIWRPNGQVLAAHGLEISTRAPRFSIAARLTQVPRNAVVCMKFGRDGIVRKAWFTAPEGTPPGTGSKEIDDSIINAVYRWRAKGEPLLSLSESDPEDAITITVRILL